MKKKLFFLAVAAVALASCSNDETIASQANSEANEIAFRTLVAGQTRATTATDVTITNISPFNVTAFTTGNESGTAYMNDVTYTTDNNGSGTYYVGGSSTAAGQYYWPTSALDFFAYKTSVGSEIVKKAYNVFDVTPTATASDPTTQGDLVFAALSNAGKATYSASGVPLNFKHACSKISVKLKNSQTNLKFVISGWKIANVKNSGRFTYTHGALDAGKGTQTLTNAMWADLSTSADPAAAANTATTSYTSTFSKTISGITEPVGVDDQGTPASIGSMILIPQTLTSASAYSGTSAGDAITSGAYLAVKMVIKNPTDDAVIADATTQVSSKDKWAIWPIPAITWEPGKHYIFTVDLADGGYWELNDKGSDATLDPILENAVIKFASVTVDDWNSDNFVDVPTLTFDASSSTSGTYTTPAVTAGTYTVVVKGLTSGTYTVEKDGDGIISNVSTSDLSSAVTEITISFTVSGTAGNQNILIKDSGSATKFTLNVVTPAS